MKIFGQEIPIHEKVDLKKLQLISEFKFPANEMPEDWRISYIQSNPISLSFETEDRKRSCYISYEEEREKFTVNFYSNDLSNKSKDDGLKEFDDMKSAAQYVINKMKMKKSVKQQLKIFGKKYANL